MLTSSQYTVKNMRIKQFLTKFLIISAFSAFSSVSIAEMYKWVDEEGNTHYTQSPPPAGIKGSTIKPPSKVDSEHASKQLENRQKYVDDARANRHKLTDKKDEDRQSAEKSQAKCEQARARLASYQRPRVNLVDKDGNPNRATEEQRQAEIAKSRKLVSELCK